MAKKCIGCGRFANTTEGVTCTKCANFYHKACVAIPNDAQVAPTWICPECKAHTPRKDNSETPVRGKRDDYSVTQDSPASAASASESASVSVELLKEIKSMRRDMESFRTEFRALRDSLGAVHSAVESLGGRIDSMEARLDGLETKYVELKVRPESDMSALLSTIEELKTQINERDQEAFSNDVEISGVPEEQGENVVHLVSVIAEKLGVSWDERDLVSAHRAGVRRAPAGSDPDAPPRSRLIMVRLARRQLRDAILQAARMRRGATTAGMGLSNDPAKFYVNERLSKHNKKVFFKAREQARAQNWKYVWTRDGRIFVRRETGSGALRVRSEEDLKKIFGGDSQ